MFEIKDSDVPALIRLLKKELLEIAEPNVFNKLKEILKVLDDVNPKLSDPLLEQVIKETPTLRKIIAENIYPKLKEMVKEMRKF